MNKDQWPENGWPFPPYPLRSEALIQRLREEATHDLHYETVTLLLEAAEALAQPAPVQTDCVCICPSHFVGTKEYGPEELKWFRFGEAAHGIKE